ncbi:transcription elongation factor SPT4, putative [Plasmodium knowlesi strain H]|uniref:Transcription elongation factor SPT4, putative n=3 Tax=Plasmodium knowlesi TaxID=5850 RepID=A0A5K1U5Q3_PLAKH|nr:transcription elongation factor SPT4, putative [Plasmodium knowlesi strain H]OTN68328.1 putative Transcription elongation factor SPT4 [Plasmodium knowlesi]CAA9987197.1 transcription elongation factor SPT4, putative [Plasmodium knowlesi strain H]SBO23960.1 transcription elongation factor SPT4, putative [Plasmodium knowlesi strain H]SBO25910.1 transcription elongation factor SPT4, putative [Plasmodium knowlesi strain H]VVS76671.1 transcription elongation factor SPT4, putative [Plasmodium know|eukprot:XP_002261818.1 transcription factor, putative [Plasmodium knowlesi strain H]
MATPKGRKKSDKEKIDESFSEHKESPKKSRNNMQEEKALKMRACLSCRLLRTEAEFYQNGCSNCKFLQMAGDRHRIHDCTTENFNGFMAITTPTKSWMAQYNDLSKYAPGFYALQVVGELPESIRDLRPNY